MPATDSPLSDDDMAEMAREARSNTAMNRLAEIEAIASLRWFESVGITFTLPVGTAEEPASESDDDDTE
jgi:hypothetical protein